MRGMAALWVLAYHLDAWAPGGTRPWPAFSRGYLGVDFFFMLSGFILAARYGSLGFAWKPWLQFVFIRAARLFPLNVTMVGATVLCAVFVGVRYPPGQILVEMMLVHHWPFVGDYSRSIDGPAWSISTEWLTNLAFPVFVALTLRPRASVALCVLAIAAATCAWLWFAHDDNMDIARANSCRPFMRCAAEFAIGMLLYRWRAWATWRPPLCLLIAIVAIVVLQAFRGSDLIIVAILALTIPVCAALEGPARRTLSARPLLWLGNMSFSIYLTQEPILVAARAVAQRFDDPFVSLIVFIVGSIGVTFVVSIATRRWIETPPQRWSKAVARGL